jgi:hypothetical protein
MYMLSVILVVLSLIVSLALGASEVWIVITVSSLLLTAFPFVGISIAKKGTTATVTGFTEKATGYGTIERTYTSGPADARGLGLAYGILMLIFTVAPVAMDYDIYAADIPGGVLIFLSGILALIGAFSYDRQDQISANYSSSQHTPTATKEKEVIIKVRCPYCKSTYDETLDKCPHCGGKR